MSYWKRTICTSSMILLLGLSSACAFHAPSGTLVLGRAGVCTGDALVEKRGADAADAICENGTFIYGGSISDNATEAGSGAAKLLLPGAVTP